MRLLVFIDDDVDELEKFRTIVEGEYRYEKVHWPTQATRLSRMAKPAIFVSDLYLPPRGRRERTPTRAQRARVERAADRVAKRFCRLYGDPARSDKARLQETMGAILDAYAMLALQWKALGQSPKHGIALCREVRRRYPDVPFVFYSRKITPEDVIAVLRAGAVDAIRKGPDRPDVRDRVRDRLEKAQVFYAREDVGSLRARGSTLTSPS